MTKRQKREADDRAALLERLCDMALGAGGVAIPSLESADRGDLAGEMGIEAWLRWIRAIQIQWGGKEGDEKNGHGLCPPAMFAVWNLETWREWESAVDTLYRHGCRA